MLQELDTDRQTFSSQEAFADRLHKNRVLEACRSVNLGSCIDLGCPHFRRFKVFDTLTHYADPTGTGFKSSIHIIDSFPGSHILKQAREPFFGQAACFIAEHCPKVAMLSHLKKFPE
jgi:hypothetical protein